MKDAIQIIQYDNNIFVPSNSMLDKPAYIFVLCFAYNILLGGINTLHTSEDSCFFTLFESNYLSILIGIFNIKYEWIKLSN